MQRRLMTMEYESESVCMRIYAAEKYHREMVILVTGCLRKKIVESRNRKERSQADFEDVELHSIIHQVRSMVQLILQTWSGGFHYLRMVS